MVVEGLLYTEDHEWARVEGQIATIGITDYAQEQLGEITFVELPAVGAEFNQKAEIAAVESSKAASDIYAPVTGKVVEINSALESEPEKINEDCYGAGWLCKIEVTDNDSVKKLMDSKKYEQYLKGL
ncbi:MAG: glycine cleavage system protein GcvH [Phycisphaerales bacterium]|jgi:glycine cleavage system H protein